jgi:hypothetical protein
MYYQVRTNLYELLMPEIEFLVTFEDKVWPRCHVNPAYLGIHDYTLYRCWLLFEIK